VPIADNPFSELTINLLLTQTDVFLNGQQDHLENFHQCLVGMVTAIYEEKRQPFGFAEKEEEL
jgi:NADH:ubiquinone oxidoreductase subunit H